MFTRIAPQATAFGMSAVATLSLLATVQALATMPAQPGQLAASTQPTQVVVITGQRIARS